MAASRRNRPPGRLRGGRLGLKRGGNWGLWGAPGVTGIVVERLRRCPSTVGERARRGMIQVTTQCRNPRVIESSVKTSSTTMSAPGIPSAPLRRFCRAKAVVAGTGALRGCGGPLSRLQVCMQLECRWRHVPERTAEALRVHQYSGGLYWHN